MASLYFANILARHFQGEGDYLYNFGMKDFHWVASLDLCLHCVSQYHAQEWSPMGEVNQKMGRECVRAQLC